MPDPIRILVTVANPEGIHPELMRDDVGDALAAAGFGEITLDVIEHEEVAQTLPHRFVPTPLNSAEGCAICGCAASHPVHAA